MRLGNIGLGWNARSGLLRATFLAPVVACWLLLLISRAGYRLHDVGPGMVLLAAFGVVWAGFVAWRVAMNEHASAAARALTSVHFSHRRT